ncbi:MAG: hypothetical protein LIR50_14945 [Bacillota bacterium]|jgi:hypothetical protein|nr:hypothetical protein [Bacillota bacterium]
MHIYEIKTCWYNEEAKDDVYGFSYIISDKKYSHKEFSALCEEARNILGKNTWDIGDYLIEKYNFKPMPVQEYFEYDPYEE